MYAFYFAYHRSYKCIITINFEGHKRERNKTILKYSEVLEFPLLRETRELCFYIQVLEACVKNCGETFHKELATKEFMEFMKDQAKVSLISLVVVEPLFVSNPFP